MTVANKRNRNGESTKIVKSAMRRRESLRWPASSIKPTEPAAPATAINDAALESRVSLARNTRPLAIIQFHTRNSLDREITIGDD
jgi:hypothetical protein